MNGLILVNKPSGLTSHDVVSRLRKILGIRRVGHFGTLDPMATGLLLVGVGKATRLFPVLSRQDKAYAARIRLGLATDTYDAEGRPISHPSGVLPGEGEVVQAMARLTGTIAQVPPPYSAKKVGGKPLYKWARQKKPVELKPHPVTIHAFRLIKYIPPEVDAEIECSSGTYIRSLAHDLGRGLGCGAHLAALCRTRVGKFQLERALSLEKIQELAANQRVQEFILPLESLLEEWPKLILNRQVEKELGKEKPIPIEKITGMKVGKTDQILLGSGERFLRLFSSEGKFLALARPDESGQKLIPFLLLR